MGLGKTVQMIATMVINQPGPDERNRSTLIIVPAALLEQWKDELETKTNGMFDVHIQHGKDKIKDPELLEEKDVCFRSLRYQVPAHRAHVCPPAGCNHDIPYP